MQSTDIKANTSIPKLQAAIRQAADALLSRQAADGHWCFELESDATITAE
ncbi:hypothetical protein ACYJW8_05145, partial [Frateuria aurantia]